ncbi:MAG: chromate transporter [Clostridia bacterium]|nr:chromate transporter [Clostridia bacterium]
MIKALFQLFITFFKIGLLAFGGGYAVISLLQKEAVEGRKWISNEELTDMMAIAQTLPGVIYVNSSTMVGYRVCGLLGALTATFASIIPTFMIVLVITVFLWDYTNNPIAKKIFTGVLLGVTALVIHSIFKMWKSVVKSYFDLILVIISSCLLIVFKTSVILVIVGVAFAGFMRNLYKFKSEGKVQ